MNSLNVPFCLRIKSSSLSHILLSGSDGFLWISDHSIFIRRINVIKLGQYRAQSKFNYPHRKNSPHRGFIMGRQSHFQFIKLRIFQWRRLVLSSGCTIIFCFCHAPFWWFCLSHITNLCGCNVSTNRRILKAPGNIIFMQIERWTSLFGEVNRICGSRRDALRMCDNVQRPFLLLVGPCHRWDIIRRRACCHCLTTPE